MKYGVPAQKFIYSRGMAGKIPRLPIDFESLQSKARKVMKPEAYAYVAGGAGRGTTMVANQEAFETYQLKASMMKAVQEVDLRVNVLGAEFITPLLTAPIGALDLVHPQGDKAVARACNHLNIPMVFSCQASHSMEVCSEELGHTPRWFQLYWSKSDELVESFVSRAQRTGCSAIVVTLDTTSLGWRPRDLNQGYLPFLRGMGLAQYSSDPVFENILRQRMLKKNNDPKPSVTFKTLSNVFGLCRNYPGGLWNNLRSGRALAAVKTFIDIYMRPELRWTDVQRLRKMTTLPIVLKGIQTVDDANKAFDFGADGIVVSNHGGRQIDGGTGALKCLDVITQNIEGRGTVLFDSGIRGGADVIKALALGADAVLIGRPWVYGLALDGQRGVEAVLGYFLAELELQLSLMGVKSVQELDRSIFSDRVE